MHPANPSDPRDPRTDRERRLVHTTLGEWIAALYDACLEAYGDEQLAEIAAATLVQERLLAAGRWGERAAAA